MPGTIAGSTKKNWNDELKRAVVDESARLRLLHPHLNDLKLIRKAQAVLPPEKQREIMSVAVPNYDWFRRMLPEALERAKLDATPEPFAAPAEDLSWAIETPGEAAPLPDPPSGFMSLLHALIAAIEAQDASQQKAAQEMNERHRAIEARLAEQNAKLDYLLRHGMTFRITPVDPMPMTPAAYGPPRLQPAPPPPPTAQPQPSYPAHPSTNGKAQTPAPFTLQTRKARVVVLSMESGHQRNGVKNEVGDRFAKLEFWEAPKKLNALNDFDYVVCTKKTPTEWIAEAKKVFGPSKVRAFPGDAHRIGEALKQLPEIEVK